MNAVSLLEAIARVFTDVRLEAVLIGNAAAAIEGAPVTTDDFDFMWRPTRMNLAKIRAAATVLGAHVSQPAYPLSRFYRILDVRNGLQIDMMGVVEGVKSFESLRSRAQAISFGDATLLVASLKDVIASKRQAGREKDLAVLPILEATLRQKVEEHGEARKR